MNELDRIKLNTTKEIMHIWDEMYGRSHAKPPLKQVVPGKYYRRGDHTHIKCLRCGSKLLPEERVNYMGRCTKCEEYYNSRPYPKQDWKQHCQKMEKAMVLANSCDYERWS
jgi:hypothetical protein